MLQPLPSPPPPLEWPANYATPKRASKTQPWQGSESYPGPWYANVRNWCLKSITLAVHHCGSSDAVTLASYQIAWLLAERNPLLMKLCFYQVSGQKNQSQPGSRQNKCFYFDQADQVSSG